MNTRIAWKIIMQGSDSNHREGTKKKARKRALGDWGGSGQFSAADIADLVLYAIKTKTKARA